jgi:hypothetical protein
LGFAIFLARGSEGQVVPDRLICIYTWRIGMKRFAIASLVLAMALMAGASYAGPPLNGTYQSTDLGGPLDLGRYSESFAAPGGGLDPGVVYNAQSFDGAALGLQWSYSCGLMVAPPMLLIDNVNPSTGNGNRTYMKTFVGGTIWLSGSGPWANGDPEYTGIVDSYTVFETVMYNSWQRVAAVFNVDATAHIDGYASQCMTLGIGNGTQIGSTDWGQTKPSDYPDLLEQGPCAPGAAYGGWWDMATITMTISGCSVPVEETTWGAIKALYNE